MYIQCLTYFFVVFTSYLSLYFSSCAAFFFHYIAYLIKVKGFLFPSFFFVFLFSLKEVYVDGMCVVKHSNNNFVEKYITMYEACIMQSIHIETWSYRHNKDIKSYFRSSRIMIAIRLVFVTTLRKFVILLPYEFLILGVW